MKLKLSAFAVTALLAFNASAQPAAQTPPTAPKVPPGLAQRMPQGRPPGMPNTPPPPMPGKDQLSYALGVSIGNQFFKREFLDLDVDTIVAGMKDALAGNTNRMSESEIKETMTHFQQALNGWVATKSKQKGEDYLTKNRQALGVITLSNGIEYKVIKEGTGEMPKTNDSVVVNYKGTFIDGSVFDQKDGFSTKVTGQTIKGWSEILPMMKTGSKWEVTIPSDLGYGPRGRQGIGPNSVLIFDMELVSIAPPPPPPPVPSTNPAPTHVSNPLTTPGPPAPPSPGGGTTPVVSGQIIKVPSAEELKKGAKIEVITNAPNSQ